MKRIAPHTLLGIFSIAALICTVVAVFMAGALSVWAVVLLGFFDSIMFPTIFALSIKNLGVYTKARIFAVRDVNHRWCRSFPP